VPLEAVLRSFGDVKLVEDLLSTPELIMISSDDEEPEDQLEGDLNDKEDLHKEEPEEDPTEDLDMGEPHPG